MGLLFLTSRPFGMVGLLAAGGGGGGGGGELLGFFDMFVLKDRLNHRMNGFRIGSKLAAPNGANESSKNLLEP